MGALLVTLQIALTMTMIANIASIVVSRSALFMRPTGTDEESLFALGYRFTNNDGTQGMLDADLVSVRSVPGVVDAVATNSYPLRGSGLQQGVSLRPGESASQAAGGLATVYTMDAHGLSTLGLQLASGRNFQSEEVVTGSSESGATANVAIITKSLARSLFVNREALGEQIYLTSGDGSPPLLVIGIVERLQGVAAAGTLDPKLSENSVILPIRSAGRSGLFIVRTKPGLLDETMLQVQAALEKNNPNRFFGRLRPFTEIRASAYEKDRSIAIALTIAALVLIVITVLSVAGLTSYWVVRRRLQIGIRRAMGATRVAIVRYFLMENAMLCAVGVALGGAIALSANGWLLVRYGVEPIPIFELIACSAAIMVVGQLAALLPAARAARVDPAVTLRVVA